MQTVCDQNLPEETAENPGIPVMPPHEASLARLVLFSGLVISGLILLAAYAMGLY